MMNNIFSFKRFSMLFNKHTIEQYKIYLMALGVLAGLLIFIMGIVSYTGRGFLSEGFQFALFMTFFLLSGCIFTSLMFADLGDKRKAIPVLILPASHLEKYLVVWIYSFVVFQLVFLLCFYAIDLTFLGMYKASDHSGKVAVINLLNGSQKYYLIFIAYAGLHSISFFGAIFFEKFHFIKTACTFFLFVLIMFLVNKPIASLIFDVKVSEAVPFGNVNIVENKIDYDIQPFHSVFSLMWYAMMVLTILLWVGAYFKLKEKEV